MDIIELLKVIFLGIVEGITEWLPVSSTGHMILVDQFMKLKVSEEFWQMFLVVIQLGAVLAVVVLDFKKLWPFHKNDPSRESNWNYISTNERIGKLQKFADKYINMNKIVLWLKILVSCVPAIIVALPFNNWIEKTFMNYWVVSVMLIVYGVLFIVIENALFIGIFQLLALIPGTSRSGATIIGGILLGMSRKLAAEYTFFLAIPVMFGASFLKLIKFGLHFTGTEVVYLLLGMVVAFGVSIAAIKFLWYFLISCLHKEENRNKLTIEVLICNRNRYRQIINRNPCLYGIR